MKHPVYYISIAAIIAISITMVIQFVASAPGSRSLWFCFAAIMTTAIIILSIKLLTYANRLAYKHE